MGVGAIGDVGLGFHHFADAAPADDAALVETGGPGECEEGPLHVEQVLDELGEGSEGELPVDDAATADV